MKNNSIETVTRCCKNCGKVFKYKTPKTNHGRKPRQFCDECRDAKKREAKHKEGTGMKRRVQKVNELFEVIKQLTDYEFEVLMIEVECTVHTIMKRFMKARNEAAMKKARLEAPVDEIVAESEGSDGSLIQWRGRAVGGCRSIQGKASY